MKLPADAQSFLYVDPDLGRERKMYFTVRPCKAGPGKKLKLRGADYSIPSVTDDSTGLPKLQLRFPGAGPEWVTITKIAKDLAKAIAVTEKIPVKLNDGWETVTKFDASGKEISEWPTGLGFTNHGPVVTIDGDES